MGVQWMADRPDPKEGVMKVWVAMCEADLAGLAYVLGVYTTREDAISAAVAEVGEDGHIFNEVGGVIEVSNDGTVVITTHDVIGKRAP